MGKANINPIVLISADVEWQAVKEIISPTAIQSSPLSETFTLKLYTGTRETEIIFFHGGWGKVSASATAQYVIDHFQPDLLINLGTCGGFTGRIERGTVILVEKTIIYDILEQMCDPDEAIAYYSTEMDLSWFTENYLQAIDRSPSPIMRGLLVSADRDIVASDIPGLVEKYGAVAADWESGAIAWVAKRNGVRCLILRGVTDLVSADGGEAYGNIELFYENTRKVMQELIKQLPAWLDNIYP